MKNQKEKAGRLVRERLDATLCARIAWRESVEKILRSEDVIYVWGTGQLGAWVPFFLHSVSVGAVTVFVDNDSAHWGHEVYGIPCIAPANLPVAENPLVIIGTGAYSRVIAAQLAAMGVQRILDISDFRLNELFDDLCGVAVQDLAARVEACFDALADEESCAVLLSKLRGFFDFEAGFGRQHYYEDVCRGDQYFQDDLIHFTENSVLVDCGAYTGDTMQDFLHRGYPFRKYIAYELSRRNYEELQNNMNDMRGRVRGELIAYNYGVGEQNESVCYSDAITGAAIANEGIEGATVRLSDHLRAESVSFIKMDIEGAEIAALKGAAELIRRRRPDLAICTYHSISDLYEVPLYIHSLVPEYRLYLRHHTPVHYETVCYAVV